MHPTYINAEIKIAGQTQTSIAKSLNVHQSLVSRVIAGQATSIRVAKHISQLTKKSIFDLWPGKYEKISRCATTKKASGF